MKNKKNVALKKIVRPTIAEFPAGPVLASHIGLGSRLLFIEGPSGIEQFLKIPSWDCPPRIAV